MNTCVQKKRPYKGIEGDNDFKECSNDLKGCRKEIWPTFMIQMLCVFLCTTFADRVPLLQVNKQFYHVFSNSPHLDRKLVLRTIRDIPKRHAHVPILQNIQMDVSIASTDKMSMWQCLLLGPAASTVQHLCITSWPIKMCWLSYLEVLQHLELQSLTLIDQECMDIASLPQLTYLGLKDVRISCTAFQHLSRCKRLQTCKLQDMSLDGQIVIPGDVGCFALENLALDGVQLSESALRFIWQWAQTITRLHFYIHYFYLDKLSFVWPHVRVLKVPLCDVHDLSLQIIQVCFPKLERLEIGAICDSSRSEQVKKEQDKLCAQWPHLSVIFDDTSV